VLKEVAMERRTTMTDDAALRAADGGPAARTTVVVVLYGNAVLDLSWVPADAPVVLVHNDASLAELSCASASVTHVRPSDNVGFGQGVNLGLRQVHTERVLLANPDTKLSDEHWRLLDDGGPDDLVTVPQQDETQVPASVLNVYPTAALLLAQAWRLGRWLPRGGRGRQLAARCLGRGGETHIALMAAQPDPEVVLPLRDYWVGGSLVSLDAERLRSVDGFSGRFFLYYEDVDLCARLAERFPGMRVRLRSAAGPALHTVGGSEIRAGSRQVRRIRRHSAQVYAGGQAGGWWPACRALLAITAPGIPR
jgi:N-acetylglucosaminyl-diphospho-decaprenol L-rhamnosyltransferase